jgi:hypothetical protein
MSLGDYAIANRRSILKAFLYFYWRIKAWTEAHFVSSALVSASYKMCFGQSFYTPIKLQTNVFNS